MGLPLYQAPVESDIQSKCATGKSLAEARSSIRRHRLVRAFDARDRVRERHRRTIAEAASLDQARRRSPTIEAPSRRSVWENHTPAALDDDEALERDRRVLQDVASRIGSLDDRVFAVFGGSQPRSDTQETVRSLQRQLQNLESRSRARISNGTSAMRNDAPTSGADSSQEAFPESFYPETEDGAPIVAAVRLPSFMEGFGGSRTDNAPPRPRLSGSFEQYTLSEMRSTQDPNHPSRSSTTSPATTAPPAPLAPLAPVPPSAHPNSTNSLRRHIWDGLMNWHTVPSTRQTDEQDPTTSTSRLDGLGDRNRSLSPEGDNAWETLLTTLTPDPQPPSVGSSFASASASAAATQSTVAASSATSLANLDTHADDQSGVEPPCESGYDNDNSDMEEDEEDVLPFILPSLRYRRADGVVTDAALDLMGGSEVIQHLVRSLARREDIPDEWWAQVGLSRTLSREATAD